MRIGLLQLVGRLVDEHLAELVGRGAHLEEARERGPLRRIDELSETRRDVARPRLGRQGVGLLGPGTGLQRHRLGDRVELVSFLALKNRALELLLSTHRAPRLFVQ